LRTDHFQEGARGGGGGGGGGYDDGPSERQHVGPVTRSMTGRMDEEEGFQEIFLLWKVNY